MKLATHIPWFNPREMDDATVLQLNTGREALLQHLFEAIQERLNHPGLFHHWLVTGTRGAGKSFFLRLVQASFGERFGHQARFVLLPEEHRNIYAPHEFLAEVERMLTIEKGALGAPPAWRVEDAGRAWDDALSHLLNAFSESLLVIGVENFDELLAQAFEDATDNARLRHLMSNEPRIMLVASAVQGTFDENYAQRLFRQFQHHPLPGWDAIDHRDYLARRAQRSGRSATPRQLARIDAYSRYTGGNARAAAVLAGAILEENDPLQSATDLDAAIEKMTDYYRALIDRIPPKTRKLFDALIRGGDPASQTEIAKRTGAHQNEISRAFLWLVDQGYVGESRLPGAKAKQYRVLDRLLVQFYRMRSVSPGQRSKLALMAELLADTLAFDDKWRYALRYADEGEGQEARTLVELALQERRVELALLPEMLQSVDQLCSLGGEWPEWDAILALKKGERPIEILRRYPDDECLGQAINKALMLAKAVKLGSLVGEELTARIMTSLALSPVEQFHVLISMLSPGFSELQWSELLKIFAQETEALVALEKAHPEAISQLKSLLHQGQTYPRTVSMQILALSLLSGLRNDLIVNTTETAASWAAQAAVYWTVAGQLEYASQALHTCVEALYCMGDDDSSPTERVLAITESLRPMLDAFPAVHRVNIHRHMGLAYTQMDRHAEAYQAHASARQIALEIQQPRIATWNLGRMAWCKGQLGDLDQALILHRQAWDESLVQEDLPSAAWHLGQLARHTAVRAGVEAAWAGLDADLAKVAGHEIVTVQQLGDAVADIQKRQGDAAAFALGNAVLRGLATRLHLPTEAILRALWIDMVAAAVPHTLLRELLDEWPSLFDYTALPGLAALNALLRDWLDDLNTPAEQRALRRLSLDPDLATTLTALAEALPRRAKQRLGLMLPKAT